VSAAPQASPANEPRLLLDEHYAVQIAERLRADGHDVVAVLEEAELRAQPDAELFRWAANQGLRIVTENIKDFRPLLTQVYTSGDSIAPLLLVNPRRFPRGTDNRTQAIVQALTTWMSQPGANDRPDEDWLV
jgi:predicted nuclease of predicted toxin-antitoxin system